MMIPAAWQMPLAVVGLVLSALLAAALVRRYQEYKAYQRARLRQMAGQVDALEQAMEQLSRIPLSQPLRSAVRRFVADRYLAMRRLHRAYPDIDRRLEQARARIDGDGGMSSGRVPGVSDPSEFARLNSALDVLIGVLGNRGLSAGKGVECLQWLQEARERRAELNARYFIVRAHRAQAEGDVKTARSLLHSVLTQLYQQGPDTEFVRELYREIEDMYSRVLKGQSLLDEAGASADQSLNSSSAA